MDDMDAIKLALSMAQIDKHNGKEKPDVDVEGISSPKLIFTDNGLILVGWYDATTGWWNSFEANHNGFSKETFGNVIEWRDIYYPDDFELDEEQYR